MIPLWGDTRDEPAPEAGPVKAICRRCRRPLRDPVSLGFQIGPDCRDHLGIPRSRSNRVRVRLARVRYWTPGSEQPELAEEINEEEEPERSKQ